MTESRQGPMVLRLLVVDDHEVVRQGLVSTLGRGGGVPGGYRGGGAVFPAIVAGASGSLLKQIRARDLVSAIESVGRGESLLDPAVTEKGVERGRRIASGA